MSSVTILEWVTFFITTQRYPSTEKCLKLVPNNVNWLKECHHLSCVGLMCMRYGLSVEMSDLLSMDVEFISKSLAILTSEACVAWNSIIQASLFPLLLCCWSTYSCYVLVNILSLHGEFQVVQWRACAMWPRTGIKALLFNEFPLKSRGQNAKNNFKI